MRTVVIGEMQKGELFKIHNEFKCIRGNQDVKQLLWDLEFNSMPLQFEDNEIVQEKHSHMFQFFNN